MASIAPNIFNVMWLFNKYNKMCFGGMLPRPRISLFHNKNILGRFTCDFDENDDMSNPSIEISDSWEYTQERLSDIIVHEMIHYYLAYEKIDVYLTHGKHFISMANDFNSRFGLNITERIDVNGMNKVKRGGWFSKLFGK
jgi:hypothetical protein